MFNLFAIIAFESLTTPDKKGDFLGAKSEYEVAISGKSEMFGHPHRALGLLLEKFGDVDDAKKHLKVEYRTFIAHCR